MFPALRSSTVVLVLTGSSIVLVFLAPFFGSSMNWSISELLLGEGVAAEIFWRIRLPRVALGFLAGMALSGAGLAFQALFRNPLASPYTFGVAAGAFAILWLQGRLEALSTARGYAGMLVASMIAVTPISLRR